MHVDAAPNPPLFNSGDRKAECRYRRVDAGDSAPNGLKAKHRAAITAGLAILAVAEVVNA